MRRAELIDCIQQKQSFLCVGLDPDPTLMPEEIPHDETGIRHFLQRIIEVTMPYAVAYKINTAFFEVWGASGWKLMQELLQHIPEEILVIADAKRGDIGNSASRYAAAFFSPSGGLSRVDAVTVSPYMGHDAVQPFLTYPGKWVALLALTSNRGAGDFQLKRLENGRFLFEEVIEQSQSWGSPDNLMYVAGATRPELLGKVRGLVPRHVLLVPGVGHQGGTLRQVAEMAWRPEGPLLVNMSRQILYASAQRDYAQAAARVAADAAREMSYFLKRP